MPAIASLEDLKNVLADLDGLKGRFPEAYEEFSKMFRAHRKVGYKNICKLLLGEATPEKLKNGLSGNGDARRDGLSGNGDARRDGEA